MKFCCAFIFITLFSLQAEAQRYFEGEIKYKSTYESLHDNLDVNLLYKELGDSFTAYIQPERYALIYNGSGSLGWLKVVIDLNEGFSYTEFENSDTIKKADLSKNNAKLLNFERNLKPRKEVLGEECESVTIDYNPNDPEAFYQVHLGTYYFNPKYKLKTKAYEDNRIGFWNLYVDEAKAISLRNEIEYAPLFKTVQEAVSITEVAIEDAKFLLNPEKVVIEE